VQKLSSGLNFAFLVDFHCCQPHGTRCLLRNCHVWKMQGAQDVHNPPSLISAAPQYCRLFYFWILCTRGRWLVWSVCSLEGGPVYSVCLQETPVRVQKGSKTEWKNLMFYFGREGSYWR